MAGKKKSVVIETARELLEANGVHFNEWKKQIITTEKLKIMEGENLQWEHSVVEEAALAFITEELKSRTKNGRTKNETAVNNNEQEGDKHQ